MRLFALSDSLSLRLHLYSGLTSPHTTTRWLILQKARRHPSRRLRPAGSTWFQDLFHSPSRGSFHRSLTVLVHYRSLAVFSLGMWSSLLPTGFRVSGGTHVHLPVHQMLRLRVSHPLRTALPIPFASHLYHCRHSGVWPGTTFNPHAAAAPASYAAMGLGSSRFARRYYGNLLFSSGYVRCFSSPGSLRCSKQSVTCRQVGLPHSDSLGSLVASTSPRLFAAWPRPSSAESAKASTMCSSLTMSVFVTLVSCCLLWCAR